MARVSARALVLSPLPGLGTEYNVKVTLLIELPDGRVVTGTPSWRCTLEDGVIRLGMWVPVRVSPGDPDGAQLDGDRVPWARTVAAVMAEALGGATVKAVPPDEWRVALALGYAEQIIAGGVFTPSQAEAIRQRIRRGV
jgi:hypothetical protein